MAQAPFLDDGGGFLGESSFTDFASLNIYQRLESLVLDVNVGRRVIVVPHADDDAEKHRQNGHGQFLFGLSCGDYGVSLLHLQ